ncbi:YciI family protein [Prauserella muralis]|uniref:Dehydrogenase n=1 Tax=Prauserella muralis TaxID=588067 RepID=A0A2V4AR34_9PSEU|nr:YciI family protein [Prauserella muralis]PXY22504.1 dehydrogenase [Prauserella muralis]TWE28183.1 hypothetical protein FHX69_0835 [Prauserella muralis]
MRFMMLVKASPESEDGTLPTEQELAEMGKFNEELVKAGVMLDGNGLRESRLGARVQFSGKGQTTVVDGPFTETKELIAGYWIIDVKSLDEAIEWARRVPFGPGGEIEIRRVAEAEDFGENFTPELQEQEDRLREQMAAQRGQD